jgi:hypothetical protein
MGLSIGARRIRLLDIRRDWRCGWLGWRARDLGEQELPPGLIRVTPAQPNVTDVAALISELRSLVGGRKGRSVALAVPDACARVALFEADHVPAKDAELDAMVRWRFKTEHHADISQDRLIRLIFRLGHSGTAKTKAGVRILAMALRHDILDQYQQVCEEAGLVPMWTHLTSFGLLESFRRDMNRWERGASRGRRASRDEALFMALCEDAVTVVAFRHGCPTFVRVRGLVWKSDEPDDSREARLSREILGTLQHYRDRHPAPPHDTKQDAAPLFVANAIDLAGMDTGGSEKSEGEPPAISPPNWLGSMLTPSAASALGLSIVPMDGAALVQSFGGSRRRLPASTIPALSALVAG